METKIYEIHVKNSKENIESLVGGIALRSDRDAWYVSFVGEFKTMKIKLPRQGSKPEFLEVGESKC